MVLQVQKNKADVPWKKIFTSMPVIAVSLTAWACAWGGYTIGILTPSYFSGVLGLDLKGVSYSTLNEMELYQFTNLQFLFIFNCI